MSSDPIISLHNVSKTYRAYDHPMHGLISRISGGRIGHHKEFHALNDVSFDIHKGETVGIIGRNGSGKSTLLQIICGIRQATTGNINVIGRISALLELGSGFQPDFSGRENIFLQGAILGLSREEMEERFDDIASFADIGEYLDQPVKTYSSGMFVRLAFSIATAVKPNILVVDEALSVGDLSFQAKCFNRIHRLAKEGTSLLFVTHSVTDVIKHCSRAILLDHGYAIKDGTSKDVTNIYLEMLSDKVGKHELKPMETSASDRLHLRPFYRKEEHRWGSGEATIVDCAIYVDGIPYRSHIPSNAIVTIEIKVIFNCDILKPVYGFLVKTHDGIFLYGTNSRLAALEMVDHPAHSGEIITCKFTLPFSLNEGTYLLSFGISSDNGDGDLIVLDRRYDSGMVTVTCEASFWGIVNMRAHFEFDKD